MGRLRSELFIWLLAGNPAVVVGLVAVVGVLTAHVSGGAAAFPIPQPAPVGP